MMIRKVIGWFIVAVFILSLIGAYVIMIYKEGWDVLLGLLLSIAVMGVFLFGVYLIVEE